MTRRAIFGSVKAPEVENYTTSERCWYDIGMVQGMKIMCRHAFVFFFAYSVFSVLMLLIQFFASSTYTMDYALGAVVALGACTLLLNFQSVRAIKEMIDDSESRMEGGDDR